MLMLMPMININASNKCAATPFHSPDSLEIANFAQNFFSALPTLQPQPSTSTLDTISVQQSGSADPLMPSVDRGDTHAIA